MKGGSEKIVSIGGCGAAGMMRSALNNPRKLPIPFVHHRRVLEAQANNEI